MPSKPRFISKSPLTAVALAALTAGTGVTVSRVDHANQYNVQQASAAGGGDRQMQVVVLGNPFDMSQPALEMAVIDAMQSSPFSVPINYAINPEPGPQPALQGCARLQSREYSRSRQAVRIHRQPEICRRGGR